MTMTVTHLVTVETGYDKHIGDYARPVCSCGWVGPAQDHTGAAANGYAHRDDAVGPATGVDLACSDLLGVMDDLARAVSWLAETWPDDLPAPGWTSSGAHYDYERPAFTVRAYCCDPAELARAAGVMGVATVDDPAPNSIGSRYRRAERRFGRVLVLAYRALDDDEETL